MRDCDCDALWVEQCLDGDREVFGRLVERYQQPVFNLAMSMTNRNYGDAAELTQDTFVRAFQKLHSYRSQYAFRNWVMTICANLAKNRFRTVARRQQAEEAYLERNPGRTYHDDPAHRAFRAALSRLPENVRVPLTLRHVEGLSYEEIASVLGIGKSAAKMRVSRGKEQLAAWLQNPSKEETAC
jgi:RNA polymerase sigma-70 factor (ECF subfamily)